MIPKPAFPGCPTSDHSHTSETTSVSQRQPNCIPKIPIQKPGLTSRELPGESQGDEEEGQPHSDELQEAITGQLQPQALGSGSTGIWEESIGEHVLSGCVREGHLCMEEEETMVLLLLPGGSGVV